MFCVFEMDLLKCKSKKDVGSQSRKLKPNRGSGSKYLNFVKLICSLIYDKYKYDFLPLHRTHSDTFSHFLCIRICFLLVEFDSFQFHRLLSHCRILKLCQVNLAKVFKLHSMQYTCGNLCTPLIAHLLIFVLSINL